MPNYKLSVSQRNHDTTGWHSSSQFQYDDINNIRVLNARNDKSLNAIPSPLARIHLFESAFSLVYQDELNGTNVSGDAYKKLVSDCFDVFELLFNWNNHIREGKDLKIITWNGETETENLKREFKEEKARKEAELRKLQNENQSLNLQQIKGFKEYLVGDTLDLFLKTGAFAEYNEIHIILLNKRPIAGTSPLTGFFTTPNDLTNINLVNPISKRNYFSRHLPFSQRDSKIKKYIYDFFVTHGVNIFHDRLPIRSYLEYHAVNIGNSVLKLEPLNTNENKIFNQIIRLHSNAERGVFDYFENHLVKLNYRLNEDCFYTATNLRRDRKHDFLLPLTTNFFADFELSDINSMVTINERDANTVEVAIRSGNQTLSKLYQANRVKEQDGFLIDLAATHSMKLDLGIFPFLKISNDDEFNDFYRVMFVSQDNNYQFRNDDFKLKFGKDRNLIDPQASVNYKISKEDRTVLEKKKSYVGSTYYSLNFCFDFIQIELPQISQSGVKCMIVPKWILKSLGNNQVDFAIDFGTTTTFVAYTDDPNHQTLPKRFELNERQVPVALLNKPREKKPELRWIDCFEHNSVLPDFIEFFEVQKQEFVPSLLNADKYSLPFRTAMYEKNSIPPNQKRALSNSNIAFAYQKDYDNVTHLNQDYITNLKWNVKTDSKYKESIEVFIEELFHLLRIKTLLSDGNPRISNISWFSPLSFTPGAQFTYNQIWSNKYSQVFKGNADTKLKNITESEAPYYYYSKIMADGGGAEGIEDTSSVMTLDIGGGTTDFMYFREGIPVIGTSIQFGANVLWGNAYSEFNAEKFNGIYLAIKNIIAERLKSTELKALNETFIKPDSPFGSDEIINFWIWNNDKSGVLKELNKGDFKFSYLLHFSALIYHSYRLLQYYNHPAPKCIIFTGNGSKYLDLIQTKDYIQKICGFFVKELFGNNERIPQVILPANNRKEATCFGGLYQPFGGQRKFSAVNYLGFESTNDNFKKYSDIDLQKVQIYNSLASSFSEFINCFFKMNEFKELSFRGTFTIESNLNAVKNFILSKSRENLSTGYDKRRKLVDGGDEITDSLFFYPIVGLIYQINNLTKEKLNEYIERTTFFALSPDDDASFDVSRLSTDQKPDSIFSIYIDNTNPDFGEIILIDDASANKRAMAGLNAFLKSVCEFDEYPDNVSQSIQVIEPGSIAKEKETGRWVITQKIKIKFVS
ncbi:hypothetical protein [Runella sp.]|uniref:hypothetical protein n=1 Tax=Runella sp. TaxID=1960881 RepID=UPI003D09B45F